MLLSGIYFKIKMQFYWVKPIWTNLQWVLPVKLPALAVLLILIILITLQAAVPAAAASCVSGNIAVFGLGSDTGGSIRQPASFCGVVGLKPTYGTVSRYGLIAYASSFDQIGPITTSVEDAALVFDAIAQHDPMDSTSQGKKESASASLTKEIKGMKIGIVKEYFEGINEDVRTAMEKSIETYRQLGS